MLAEVVSGDEMRGLTISYLIEKRLNGCAHMLRPR
jgi:hypothetical protein